MHRLTNLFTNSSLTRSLYLIALAHLTLELCANFLPVLYPRLIATMGLTYAQVGVIALVMSLAGTLAQPVFGYLSDRWDPQGLMLFSLVWIGLLMGLVGLVESYLWLLVLVGLAGLSSAAFHPAAATLASSTTTEQRGTAISIFTVGGNLGSAFSPLWFTLGLGWLGLTTTTTFIPVALLVGLLLWRYLEPWTRPAAPAAASPSQSAGTKSRRRTLAGSLGALALIVVAVMCRSWFQVSFMTYLPEWMRQQGWTLAVGGQVLTLFLIAISAGGLLGGALSDRFGRWQVVAVSLGLMAPAHWFFMIHTGLLQVGLTGLIGFLIGLSFPVTIVMAQEVWPQGIGLASALVMGLGWLPGGIGASVIGLIADRASLGAGLQTLVIIPVIGLICVLLFALLRQPHKAILSQSQT